MNEFSCVPKRNGTISLLKLFFSLVIILMHYSIPSEIGGTGYLFGGGVYLC